VRTEQFSSNKAPKRVWCLWKFDFPKSEKIWHDEREWNFCASHIESGRSFFLQDAQLNAASPILRLTRSGETAWGPLPGGDWTIFQANHSTYEPLAWAYRDSLDYPANKSPLATVIQVSSALYLLDIPVTYLFPDNSDDCGINAPTRAPMPITVRRQGPFKSFSLLSCVLDLTRCYVRNPLV